MEKFTPAAPYLTAHNGPDGNNNCTIVDASALLYQAALRAAVVREQVAMLATRLAMARWTARNLAPAGQADYLAPPCRAAFYARAQEDFFSWIERGGVWEGDGTSTMPASTQNDGAEAVVYTTELLQRGTPSEE
ncbi:MAG: hypothetical protein M3Y65_07650 [Pseudomonadota bacterium]|nr:hypothetical protein [Pseudomonadota bacterium]